MKHDTQSVIGPPFPSYTVVPSITVWGPVHLKLSAAFFFFSHQSTRVLDRSFTFFSSHLFVSLLYNSICILRLPESIFLNTNTGLYWCLFYPWNSTDPFMDPDISNLPPSFSQSLLIHPTTLVCLWIYIWIHSSSQKTHAKQCAGHQWLTTENKTDFQLPRNWQSSREYAHPSANYTGIPQMDQLVQMRGVGCRGCKDETHWAVGQHLEQAFSWLLLRQGLEPHWTQSLSSAIFASLPVLWQGIISLTMITNIQELTLSPSLPLLSQFSLLNYGLISSNALYRQLQCFRGTSNSTY